MSLNLPRLIVVLALVCSAFISLPSLGIKPTQAAVFQVTNLNDSGAGSLRSAITNANGYAGDDSVVFTVGTGQVITLSSALPTITEDVSITGPSNQVTISAHNAFRSGFAIGSGLTVSLSNLIFTYGLSLQGGAISAPQATLTVNNCRFVGNVCPVQQSGPEGYDNGSAIWITGGSLDVRDCYFGANSTRGYGAIYSDSAPVAVRRSLFFGNVGNGIFLHAPFNAPAPAAIDAVIEDCYFENNSSPVGGGLYSDFRAISCSNCTFAFNKATLNGGAILLNTDENVASVSSLVNCTFIGNYAANNYGVDNSPRGNAINHNGAAVSVQNCTFIGNVAPPTFSKAALHAFYSGTRMSNAGASQISNTLFSESGTSPIYAFAINTNTSSGLVSGGYNLSDVDASQYLNQPSDLNNTIAGLDPNGLQDNGGTTIGGSGGSSLKTIALLPTSAARNGGNPTFNGAGKTDARGAGFPRVVGGRMDIGAFEAPDPAQSGSTLVVNTLGDTNDGTCGVSDCSLREAIIAANANADASVITYQSGLTGTTTLGSSLPDLVNRTDIQGPGANVVSISGNNLVQPFRIAQGVTVSVSGLTVRNGKAGLGGAFYSRGNLTLTACFLTENRATFGGAISTDYATPTQLTLRDCTLSGNSCSNSTPGGSSFGGAIHNGGVLTATNCTFTQNTSSGSVAAIASGTNTLNNCTVTGNTAPDSGVGLSGELTLNNSIVVGNGGPTGRDISAVGTIQGDYNVLGAANGQTLAGTHNQVGVDFSDLKLGSLAANGGPTPTLLPLSGSLAINAGNPAFSNANLPTDQRGSGFPRVKGGRVDAGALETAFEFPSLVVTIKSDTNSNTDGFTSLREAITYANSNPDASVITFSPNVKGSIVLSNLLPALSTPMSINGPGAGVLAISGNGIRLFEVSGGVDVTISGLAIKNGNGQGATTGGTGGAISNGGNLTLSGCVLSENGTSIGGAVYNTGSLTVVNSTLSGNSAGDGGAISNLGTLVVERSTLIGNNSSNLGGAIINSGNLTVKSSTLSGNSTANGGGAIFNNSGAITIQNSTLASNKADQGGAFYNYNGYQKPATATVLNSTIAFNKVDQDGNGFGIGGAFYNDLGNIVTMKYTIVAGNTRGNSALADNIANAGSFTSQGYNLCSDAAGGGAGTGPDGLLNGPGDKRKLDPKLDVLKANGGPTQTIALLANSPAINAGEPIYDGSEPYDQRGVGFPRVVDGRIDIGAVEFPNLSPAVVALTGPTGERSYGDGPLASPQLSGSSLSYEFVNFTTVVRDDNGVADLTRVTFTLGSGSSILTLRYDAQANTIVAIGSNGTSASAAPGSANVLTVSSGELDCAGTTVQRASNQMIIVWRLKITSASYVTQLLRLQVNDAKGASSPVVAFGSWRFGPATAPTLVSVKAPNGVTAKVTGTPGAVSPLLNGSSPTDQFVDFTTTVYDENGAGDLGTVTFYLGSGASELRLIYDGSKNLMWAVRQTTTTPKAAPGSTTVLTLPSGALDCSASSVRRSGNQLIIVWRLKITAPSSVQQELRLLAQDRGLAFSERLTFGSWTFVPPVQDAPAVEATAPKGVSGGSS